MTKEAPTREDAIRAIIGTAAHYWSQHPGTVTNRELHTLSELFLYENPILPTTEELAEKLSKTPPKLPEKSNAKAS